MAVWPGVFAVLVTLALILLALGLHNALGKFLALLDGHLERLQVKLDVLVVAQSEHNQKLDVILGKIL